ncbi:MAG: LysR family transcriptional regulator [Hyphomicrobiaceae bacterium]|nr:LysR family transcriptional regulator [Hyphomicrobiaceae bacterium]
MKHPITLRFIEIFIAAAETGNMSKAARKLGISQAAISQNIRQVEQALDTDLFDRSTRPFRLTTAGNVLQARAYHLLGIANETWGTIRELGNSSLLELRLAAMNSLAGPLLPDLFEQSRSNMWQDSFSMRSGLSFDQNEALLNHEVDAVMTSDPMEGVAGLDRRALLKETFLVAGPASMTTPPDDLERLAEELPFLRYNAHNMMGRTVDQHLRRLRIDVPRRAEFDSSWSIGEMIRAGKGWAIMTPLCLLEAHLRPQDVSVHAFPHVELSRTIWLVTRQGELGHIPDELMALSQEILARRRDQEIAAFGDLARSAFHVLDDPTAPLQ